MPLKFGPVALAMIGAASLALAAAGGLSAQQPSPGQMPMQGQMPMHGQMQHGTGQGPTTPATKAYQAANAKMHKDMTINYTGDANKDFVAGMIPHHQGAIDMAKIVLQYGNDPELRKLADEIIAAQSKEIAFLRAWQARNP
jgi:uncharacterized protein (DUF305 family)